jgi:uncharacterized iron-regulated membrane protein
MNSKRIRKVMFVIHRYIGLAVGILAAAIGLTGSLLIIHGWTEPFATQITPSGERMSILNLMTHARSLFPERTLQEIILPQSLTESVTTWWDIKGQEPIRVFLNPYTGETVGRPHQEGTGYIAFLYNLHITLMGGEGGAYIAGLVGLLTTILCVTGIVLWPGWRKLKSGFTIKWNAHLKRLNFDLHKVAGIIAAVFLAMAMGTGFIWNYGTWMNPVIYALTFSPPPAEIAHVSKPIANQPPIPVNTELIQATSAALPQGDITSIHFPTKLDDVIRISKTIKEQEVTAIVDQYSGKIIKIDNPLLRQKSLGDRILDSFTPVHFGTFAGEASRILYIFVGLSPAILMTTGFIMWWHRKRTQPAPVFQLHRKPAKPRV